VWPEPVLTSTAIPLCVTPMPGDMCVGRREH
jgi:hypothetical protein